MFGSVNSVAVTHHPESGIWFFADYDLVSDAFANPDLIRRHKAHRDAVRGYLHDESIPPWVFDILRRMVPEKADTVFQAILGKPTFRWDTDGDELMRHHKRDYFLSLIHISEPTRRTPISYAVFC